MLLVMYILVAILMFAVVSGKVPHEYDTILYVLIFAFLAYHVYRLANYDNADISESFDKFNPGSIPKPKTYTIDIGSGFVGPGYSPNLLDIKVGDTVQWSNKDSSIHTVTSTAGKFDSGDIKPGQIYKMTFDKPGGYPYGCKYHKNNRQGGIIRVI